MKLVGKPCKPQNSAQHQHAILHITHRNLSAALAGVSASISPFEKTLPRPIVPGCSPGFSLFFDGLARSLAAPAGIRQFLFPSRRIEAFLAVNASGVIALMAAAKAHA
jgi:hypothetical protein